MSARKLARGPRARGGVSGDSGLLKHAHRGCMGEGEPRARGEGGVGGGGAEARASPASAGAIEGVSGGGGSTRRGRRNPLPPSSHLGLVDYAAVEARGPLGLEALAEEPSVDNVTSVRTLESADGSGGTRALIPMSPIRLTTGAILMAQEVERQLLSL
jgi:hypothetical protein